MGDRPFCHWHRDRTPEAAVGTCRLTVAVPGLLATDDVAVMVMGELGLGSAAGAVYIPCLVNRAVAGSGNRPSHSLISRVADRGRELLGLCWSSRQARIQRVHRTGCHRDGRCRCRIAASRRRPGIQ